MNESKSPTPVERRGYLVDNSVLQKLSRSANIQRRFAEITNTYPIYTCPPQVLEYCWSARNPAEYAELRRDMDLYTPAGIAPEQSAILDIHQALWDKGLMRGAGNADVLIAAYALANDLTLLTADHDFEHIQRALGHGILRQEYVAEQSDPPG
ncbi:PilT protein domain protein [Microbacterium sp. C448]|uniref:PIN domain-containing protein n=1 Tax=Microbacterium TaxID=33882 RepID=UPI0003DE0CAE|nr:MULTISPECIES: PIN domain-containing protein [Microbacterium]CDK01255.1 PilT protein domain protein [Microbacterium sp. C448]